MKCTPHPLAAYEYEVWYIGTSDKWEPVETFRAVRAIRYSYAKAEELIPFLVEGNPVRTPFANYRIKKG